jgi:hypothetical protein
MAAFLDSDSSVVWFALFSLLVLTPARPLAAACVGDCDGSSTVTVDEVVRGVGIALGSSTIDDCPAFDSDGDDEVTVPEIVTATNSALNGCPATGTPTPTQTAEIIRTPSPTPQLDQLEVIEAAAQLSVTNPAAAQVLDFGCAAADCGGQAPSSGFRFAAKGRAAGGTAQSPGVHPCEGGGSRAITCDDGTQTVMYSVCIELTASNHTVRRSGTTRLTLANRDFCADPVVRSDEDRVRVELLDYVQLERDGASQRIAEVTATLTDDFDPTRDGCAGAEGSQRIDGSIDYFCTPSAQSVDCPQAGVDFVLLASGLTFERRAGGFPCELGLTMTGQLAIDDRASGAQFSETFADFLLTEVELGDGTTRIKQDGAVAVDCLGALLFTTKIQNLPQQTGAMIFPADAACPVDGKLEVRRAPLVADGDSADPQSTGAAAQAAMELRHDLFRSANGKVYQVLQNIDSEADLGAEAVQITTLIGSEAGSVGECANAAGATSEPQAVAAAELGRAFPPTSVFKSPLIPHTSQQPCFNRNANSLDGRVCIGDGCVGGTCVCPNGAECVAFTIGGANSIVQETAGVPAATLIQTLPELADPCSGFAGRAAYTFGDGGPTTETRQCDVAPSDGFRLRSGNAIVFVYDTPLTALFNAGAGGFPVDEDGDNLIGCNQGPNRVLHLGLADLQSVPAPIITFLSDGRVQFDFDGDGSGDRTTTPEEQCRIDALAACE